MSAIEKRLGRRHALAGIGLAAGAAIPVIALTRGNEPAREPERATSRAETRPDPLEAHDLHAADSLLGGLRVGDRVGGCRIEAIYAERAGAIPLVMSTSHGERFAVEIFAADADGPEPISSAPPLAIYLVNRGDGASPTPSDIGLGVRALGRALATQLEDGAVPPSRLVSYRERRRRAPTGVFHVPV